MRGKLQRSGLLIGLIVFALVWTLLMGLGVAGVSPSTAGQSAGGSGGASALGAGAHVMYVDDSQFPEVTVYLAVNDANGQVVPGLNQDNFVLREDGKPVDILDFVGAGGGSSSTLLVIDQSGSMGDEGKMAGAIQAAQTFVSLMEPGADQLGVIAFSDTATTLAPLATLTEQNRTVINGLLATLTPLSSTEFYPATSEAIRQMAGVRGRRVVLALTDGLDNMGQLRLGQTIADAQAAKIPVYAVGLGYSVDQDGLQRLANETGGQAFFSPSAEELARLYAAIASGLRNEYALTYQSLTPSLDGTQRALGVEVATGDEQLQSDGAYTVGGILASGFNLGVFLPTLLLLAAVLGGLYVAPDLLRRRKDRAAATGGKGKEKVGSAQPGSAQDNKVTADKQAGQDGRAAAGNGESGAGRAATSPEVFAVAAPLYSAGELPPPACLVVVHRLARQETLVGSTAPSTLLLPAVAGQQARIHWSAGRYAIDDLGGGTLVSYGGDPGQLRPVQRNALREGSLVQLGATRYVFHEGAEGARLERRVPVPAGGLSVGTDATAGLSIAAPTPQLVRVRPEGKHWVVECLAGECQVSYGGALDQLRPVVDRNALKPGSCLTVGNTLLRLEAA